MKWTRVRRVGQRARDRIEWLSEDGVYRVLKVRTVEGIRLPGAHFHASVRCLIPAVGMIWDRVSGATPRTYRTEQAAKSACESHKKTRG